MRVREQGLVSNNGDEPCVGGTGPQCSRLARGVKAQGVSCTCLGGRLWRISGGDCQGLIFASCVPFQRHGVLPRPAEGEGVPVGSPCLQDPGSALLCLSRRPCWPLQKSLMSKKDEHAKPTSCAGLRHVHPPGPGKAGQGYPATWAGRTETSPPLWLRPGGQRARGPTRDGQRRYPQ